MTRKPFTELHWSTSEIEKYTIMLQKRSSTLRHTIHREITKTTTNYKSRIEVDSKQLVNNLYNQHIQRKLRTTHPPDLLDR